MLFQRFQWRGMGDHTKKGAASATGQCTAPRTGEHVPIRKHGDLFGAAAGAVL